MEHKLAMDTWGVEERAAAHEVIDSGQVTMGARVKAFERAFAERLGRKHAVMTNSGSSANLIAVAALQYRDRLPPGSNVVVPAIAWPTTYAPLQQHRLRLRVVDVDPNTLCADPQDVERAIDEKTSAIVAVSILGNPADLARMRALCNARGLALIEDNCESLGATLDGRPCGAFGDISTHSFFFSHQVATAEGGMAVTDDDHLADLMRCLRAHGWTRDLEPGNTLAAAAGDDFQEAYRFLLPGYNVRPTEIAAAVGLVQLAKLDRALAWRRANAAIFRALFGHDPRFRIQRESLGAKSSWFGFTLVPQGGLRRRDLLPALRAAGIEVRLITGGNFLQHSAKAWYDWECPYRPSGPGGCPNAKTAHDEGFFVGNHPRDMAAELRQLREVIERAVR